MPYSANWRIIHYTKMAALHPSGGAAHRYYVGCAFYWIFAF